MVKVAIVQTNPRFGDKRANLAEIERSFESAARSGAQLAVFPECSVTGYLYESIDEALAVAESIPGPASEQLAAAAERFGVHAVVGTLERDRDRCFNAAVVVGPDGLLAVYRKTHVLCLGVDRFTTLGDTPYRVLQLPFGRIGVLICYDLRFPEAARSLALAGAQIVVLPTNWPVTSSILPDAFTRARAAENRVFVLAADRVGQERGARFLGRSQVVAPDGTVLAEAGSAEPEVLLVEIDPAAADEKHVTWQRGVHEMDVVADRRPELYDRPPARVPVEAS